MQCTESTYLRAWLVWIDRGIIEGVLRQRFDINRTVDLQSSNAQGESWKTYKREAAA